MTPTRSAHKKASSIRLAVLLTAIVPALLVFALLMAYFLYDQTRLLSSAVEKEGRLLASHVALSSEYGLTSGNIGYLEEMAKTLLRNPQLEAVVISDRDGRTIVSKQRQHGSRRQSGGLLKFEAPVYLPQTAPEAFSFTNEEGRRSPAQASAPAPRLLGRVTVMMSARAADAERRSILLNGISLGLVSLAVALLVGVYIANTFTRRVEAISAAVGRIKRGNYDQPVGQMSKKDDELSVLAEDVDALAAELAGTKKSVQAHMSALTEARESAEELVRERTHELALARDEAVGANEENRRLIREMNRMLEEERRYISREIHDHLNAIIVAIRLALQRIQKRLDNPQDYTQAIADARASIGEIIDMVAHAYSTAREIVHRLRPEIIDALGLQGAIEDIAANYNRLHSECHFELAISGDMGDVGDEASIAIYRIVQEALANAVKHAAATRVQITVRREEDEGADHICVSVQDNGHGFDTSKPAQGIGILSMRERARGVGGQLHIESSIPGGTSVQAMIPVHGS